MANYQSLKTAINAVIKANGNKEITGTVLNDVLLAMVNSLGADYQFAGVATPSTNPGTPDQKVFYIASQAGTYTNFGGAVVSDGIAIFEWNGIWTTETLDLPIPEQVQSDWTETDTTKKSYIKHKPNIPPSANVDPVPTNGSPNAVASGGVYNALKTITDFLNNGYYFVGIAGTSTVPDTVTQYGIFYIASDGGTYTNFMNGDDEPLTLYQGLNILYKDIEDDGWNYFEVFKFSDFVDTTQQQSLSSQQKAQARTNIAAVSYDEQTLNDTEKVQAQNNMMGKAYSSSASDHSGLGKVYLDKNNGVLTQAMMQATNTVYVIQYDYTMSGNITVPAGCTLEFDGGSISGNYTMTFTDTTIESVRPFSITCLVSGHVLNNVINPDLFGIYYNDAAKGEYNGRSIQKCINVLPTNGGTVMFSNGNIYIDAIENEEQYTTHSNAPILIMRNNVTLDFNGATIKETTNNYLRGKLIVVCSGASNVTIQNGSLIGDIETHTGSTGEWGHGITLGECYNVTIKDMNIEDFWGDGIDTGREFGRSTTLGENIPQNVLIKNCLIRYNRRNGISITGGNHITVKGCTITDNGAKGTTDPSCGIDVEANGEYDFLGSIEIIDSVVKNNTYATGDYKPCNISFWSPNTLTDANYGGSSKLVNVDMSNTNGILDNSSFGYDTTIENVNADILTTVGYGKSNKRGNIRNSTIKKLALTNQQVKYIEACIIGSPDIPMDSEYTYCMIYVYTESRIMVSNCTICTKDAYGVNGKYAIKSSDYFFNNCIFENVGIAGTYTLNKNNATFNNCSAIGLTLGS